LPNDVTLALKLLTHLFETRVVPNSLNQSSDRSIVFAERLRRVAEAANPHRDIAAKRLLDQLECTWGEVAEYINVLSATEQIQVELPLCV
jgi:hypothetical protein